MTPLKPPGRGPGWKKSLEGGQGGWGGPGAKRNKKGARTDMKQTKWGNSVGEEWKKVERRGS